MNDPTSIRGANLLPKGFPAVADQHGHALIAAIATRPRRLETVRTLSAVAGALIATSPDAFAVLWDGRIARSAEMWLDMSRDAFASYPDYPMLLWIDTVPFRSNDTTGAVTMGLSAFVGREIE